MTIEPGIYLPRPVRRAHRGHGLLAPDGKENLTHFPKELTILG